MNSNAHNIFWICVILTMAMAFAAIMISLPRVSNIHSTIYFDYQTMIVTILGIFVTVLIGWQIWQTMISRREVERATEAARDIEHIRQELIQSRSFSQGIFWNLLGQREQSSGGFQGNRLALQYYSQALLNYVEAQADFTLHTRGVLVSMQACIENLANIEGSRDIIGELQEHINAANRAIAHLSDNIREAIQIIDSMQTTLNSISNNNSPSTPQTNPQ